MAVLHGALFLVTVASGDYPGIVGGELVGGVARGPMRGWGVQGIGPGAGAVDEAQAGPLGELGEQISGLDLEFPGEFPAVPVAAGVAEQDRGDQLPASG